ncbi:zinc finger protein 354B-like isoform X1 [Planococcus citri]|uniref:zinc finger protein 354B-like isoform X1 n=1 Tax=Planococcus citri TaxID=170843 RepID=UPI0031F84D9F
MSSLNNFSKEETARRTRNIGYRHSALHQFTNHNSRHFRDYGCPSGIGSECCGTESETEELSKKHKELSESAKCEAKTIEIVECIEKVAEGGCSIGFSMPSLKISRHDLHPSEEPLEQFSDDGCIRRITQASLVELIEKVTEDYSAKSFRLPLEISSDDHHNLEEQLEQVPDEVALVETAQNISEDAGNTIVAPIEISTNTRNITENTSNTSFIILVPSAENPNNILHNAEARPAQYFEVARSETSRNISEDIRDYLTIPFPEYSHSSLCTSNTATRPQNEDDQFLNLTTISTQILNDEVCCNVEEQSQQPSEENPTSKDPQSCFSDSTKATNGVFLLVLNEQFVKAHAGQTLRIGQVQVATQRTNCNNELNVNQRDGQTSSAGCSKSLENGGKGRISRSAKKKKKLRSAATMIQTSDSVPKKVPAVLIPPYSCKICDKTFSDKYDWGRHMRKHPEPFVCPKCNKPFSRRVNLIEHQSTHSYEQPYKCGICDTRFKTDRSKRMHEHNMHTESARFECAVCGKMFLYKKLLIAHLRVHSSGRCSKRRENGGDGWISRSMKKKKGLPSVATMIETSDSIPKKARGVLLGDSPPYCCNICDRTFTYQSVWKRHEREHIWNVFECRKCGKQYPFKSYLIRHQKTPCENKPYKCGFCDTRFKCNTYQLKHERRVHNVELEVIRFECAVCGKMFKQKGSLVGHLRLHSSQKLFRCHACGKSFPRISHLVSHQKAHNEEKNFKCGICDKLFRHQRRMITHERLHVESARFECVFCGKTFRQKQSLAYHTSKQVCSKSIQERSHAEDLYFECALCGKKYRQKYGLAYHISHNCS